MVREKAVGHFHGPDGYNCAQAVLKAFEEHLGVTEDQISAHAKLGGGRAEDGLCGALFAAKLLVESSGQAEELAERFTQKAGSQRCREIRKLKNLTCAQCVHNAAELVQSFRGLETSQK